jgi:poly [ADP-ribose] polymerase 2/3/4
MKKIMQKIVWGSYCVMQPIVVPENHLHLYFKKGRVGEDPNAEERLEECENVDHVVKEFVRLFQAHL